MPDTEIDMSALENDSQPDAAEQTSSPVMIDIAALVNMLRAPKTATASIPRFLPYDVQLWHQQCLASFNNYGIINEKDQYFQVLAKLEPGIMKQVTAYISAPTPNKTFQS